MRPIEFRAWDVTNKRMNKGGFWIGAQQGAIALVKNMQDVNVACISMQRQQDFILMQFTGLCDKNGKKIFEGDVIGRNNPAGYPRVEGQPDYQKYVIIWDDDFSGWVLMSINSWSNAYQYDKSKFKWGKDKFNSCWKNLEIIGNIHENPELMKENTDATP